MNNGEKLTIHSIIEDNNTIAEFTDKKLPRHARHGELYVVDGILYIFTTLENDNDGRWFPLTDQKEVYKFTQTEPKSIWKIPITFHTDNLQIIVYEDGRIVYPKNFIMTIGEQEVTITFDEPLSGDCYLFVNKTFDWVDKKLVVADKRLSVMPDENNKYKITVDTEFFKILENGNVDISGELNVDSLVNLNKLIVDTQATINDSLLVKNEARVNGNTIIDGNLIVKGNQTTIQTQEVVIDDNVITLNSNEDNTPTQSAGLEVNRGTEGKLPILTFNESTDKVEIPVWKSEDSKFIQDEIAGKDYVKTNLELEKTRAEFEENRIETKVDNEIIDRSQGDDQLQSNLETEISNRETADTEIQTELDDTQTGAGLETNGGYTADSSSNYLTSATSLKDADKKLDSELKSVSDDLQTETTNREAADTNLQDNINEEINRATTAETEIQNDVDKKIYYSDIVDDLTTTLSDKPLSANQGKIIKDLIDEINTILQSDDTALDELQEVVDFIKMNKNELESLAIDNIAGLQSVLDSKVDKVSGKSLVDDSKVTSYDNHLLNKNNPHNVTKLQVGLGNVDNTSDTDKPISTDTQNALNTKVDKVSGKTLSDENFTNEYRTKLDKIENGAEVNFKVINVNRNIASNNFIEFDSTNLFGYGIDLKRASITLYAVDPDSGSETYGMLVNATNFTTQAIRDNRYLRIYNEHTIDLNFDLTIMER